MSKMNSSRGSIMIWTLLMGISLATVFFFFSQRLGANAASQRETMEYLTARIFLESYVDYIQTLDPSDLEILREAPSGISFEGITGTVTNEVENIVDVVDANGESAEYKFADNVDIEWNLCASSFKSDLIVDDAGDATYSHVGPPYCAAELPGYNDETTIDVHIPFKIKSPSAPFQYRITSSTDGQLVFDNKWQLNLELPLGFRKKLTANRIFTPGP